MAWIINVMNKNPLFNCGGNLNMGVIISVGTSESNIHPGKVLGPSSFMVPMTLHESHRR